MIQVKLRYLQWQLNANIKERTSSTSSVVTKKDCKSLKRVINNHKKQNLTDLSFSPSSYAFHLPENYGKNFKVLINRWVFCPNYLNFLYFYSPRPPSWRLASQRIVDSAHVFVNVPANQNIAVTAQFLSLIHVYKEEGLFSTEILKYLRNYQHTDASSW